ncbi:TPA: LPS O-antigen chain length determinant protein WzzB [Mannheimia haemolytica]
MADSLKVTEQRSDEIDLIEIFRILWDKKWWIVITTFATTLLAGIYAFTAKEQWTSKAVVIAPKVADLGNYLSLRSEYANILNLKEFTTQSVVNHLFNNFKTSLFSDNMKREFFTKSKWFENYTAESGFDTEEKKQKFLSDILSKYLVITVPDLKKNPNAMGIDISFSAATPSDAQKVLEDYISFVNKSVLMEDKMDFLADIHIILDNLELQKDKMQKDTESIRQVQLENLNNALDIAKSAGIKEYSKTVDNIKVPQIALGDAQIPFSDSKLSDGTYLFMLGEKYLQAQVDILAKNKIVYPVSFYNIEKQVSLLRDLKKKVDHESSVRSYYYLASPDYPSTRDWPKRLIILIIAAALGGIIGCVIVIIRNILMPKH